MRKRKLFSINKKTELERLEFIYNNPPYEVVIQDYKFIVTDPLGEHHFTINYSGGKSTLEGTTVQEVIEAVKKTNQKLIIVIRYIRRTRITRWYSPTIDYPEFDEMVWSLENITAKDDDPSWEIHGYFIND